MQHIMIMYHEIGLMPTHPVQQSAAETGALELCLSQHELFLLLQIFVECILYIYIFVLFVFYVLTLFGVPEECGMRG